MTRPPKKSETLEIRLPFATKTAFMARCRADGRTASEALRRCIEQELLTAPVKARVRRGAWQAAAAAVAGLALGAVAAPSLAHTAAPSKATFEQLDRDHDGVLSLDEFHRR